MLPCSPVRALFRGPDARLADQASCHGGYLMPARVDGVGTETDSAARSAASVLTRRRAITALAAFAGGSGLLGGCTSAAPRRESAPAAATTVLDSPTPDRSPAQPAPLNVY